MSALLMLWFQESRSQWVHYILSRKCCGKYCFGSIINWGILSKVWDTNHGIGKCARESALMLDLQKARVDNNSAYNHKIGANHFNLLTNGQCVCLTAYAELFMLSRGTLLHLAETCATSSPSSQPLHGNSHIYHAHSSTKSDHIKVFIQSLVTS